MLQLASLRPYPGQDLPLARLGLAAAKLALVTRQTSSASQLSLATTLMGVFWS